MSPLVEYVGNASPQDNTEVINLTQAQDGSPRTLTRGGRALVSGDELESMVSNYQIRVLEDTDESDPGTIPTEMPSGYDENGYKEGESPSEVVFTPEAYPDDGDAPADESGGQGSGPAQIPAATAPGTPPAAPGSPGPSSAPASAPTAPSGSAPASRETSPASPGASG